MPAYKVLSSTFSLKGLAQKVSALLQQSAVCQLCEISTHLFSGVPCSCEVCGGVPHCDEYAPWTGSLTSCLNLVLPARCHGTCTTWSTLHRCRTRTPRGATHRHASSRVQDAIPVLLTAVRLYRPSPQSTLYRGTPQTFNMWPILHPTSYLEIVSPYSSAPLPSLFTLTALTLSLLFGPFFHLWVVRNWERWGWVGGKQWLKKKEKFQTSCWAHSEEKGTRGYCLV